MYVRKLTSKSGKKYVQIIDKSKGKYRVIISIGSSYSLYEISELIRKGKQWKKLKEA